MTAGAVFYTNAPIYDINTSNAWVNLASTLPAGATGAMIEVALNGSSPIWGLRKDGSSENIVHEPFSHPFAMVEANNGIIEGFEATAIYDFPVIGYFEPPIIYSTPQNSCMLMGIGV